VPEVDAATIWVESVAAATVDGNAKHDEKGRHEKSSSDAEQTREQADCKAETDR